MPFTIPNEADAGFTDQAEPDVGDFEIAQRGFQFTGVITGCQVTAQGSPDMTVAVAVGSAFSNGKRFAIAAGNVTVGAADATHPRIDLIRIDSSGVKGITAGTAAANPVFPSIPSDAAVLAAVYVPANDTDIDANQIIDKRVFMIRHDAPGFPMVAGHWHTGLSNSATMAAGGFQAAANTLCYMSFYSWGRHTYDRIGIHCAGGNAGGRLARLGIYESNVAGNPGALLLDAGEIDLTGVGAKELTISQELQAYRLYWLAFVGNSASPTYRTFVTADGGPLFANRVDSGATAGATKLISHAFTYAALPSTASALSYNSSAGPGIFLRVA